MYLQNFVMYGRRMQRLVISGSDAMWLGLAFLGLAAWFHVHFFWTNNSRLAPYAGIGTIASLLILVCGLGRVLFGQMQLI